MMANLYKKLYLFFKIAVISLLFLAAQNVVKGESLYSPQVSDWIQHFVANGEIQPDITHLDKHTTLVRYQMDGNKFGYLVVRDMNSTEPKVIEFGEGFCSPYSRDIIINNDIRGLMPVSFRYISPIESFWEYNTDYGSVFIEGSTGDWLPDLTSYAPTLVNDGSSYGLLGDSLEGYSSDSTLAFDIFEDISWLTGEKKDKLNENEMLSLLKNKEKIIYIGEKYNKVIFAYPVIGSQKIGDHYYFAIYDKFLDTTRFISRSELDDYGNFYRAKQFSIEAPTSVE